MLYKFLNVLLLFFFSLKYFLIFLETSFWPMDYWKMCYLISKCLKSFPLSFSYWFLFNFIKVRQHALNESDYCQFVCFMTQNMVYVGQRSMCTWKEYMICCCWMDPFIHTEKILLVDVFFSSSISLPIPSAASVLHGAGGGGQLGGRGCWIFQV